MPMIKGLMLLGLQIFFVDVDSTHSKPVTEVEWSGRCVQSSYALNDCNWCKCNKKLQYTCDARNCDHVDMFGHFNDAIRDIDVGMEGKGSWRASALACEPGVQYRRSGLLCVCTDDGTWPNPVCRDIFRVLHSVELTGDSEVIGQKCEPTKLYMVGCNVCFCPSEGYLDENLCTKNECSEDDPVVKSQNEDVVTEDPLFKDEEIYAECDTSQKYAIGCKTCNCLRNNRLHCGNCTFGKEKSVKSFCSYMQPHHTFNVGCNFCYCDEKGFAYCSTKKCLLKQANPSGPKVKTRAARNLAIDVLSCTLGQTYKDGCNTCYCDVKKGRKVVTCTMKPCARSVNPLEAIHTDCVKGTSYELGCLICRCVENKGIKTQLCWANPECSNSVKSRLQKSKSTNLDSLHGYCEPHHVYTKGCNSCKCLSDGKTVRCTSYTCQEEDPVSVEIVPVAQNGALCPSGLSYKIECNYCFCLSNGNAICTTRDCKKN